MNDIFRETFEVRNSELDAQGIVANHNYMVYLTHTRHKFGSTLGIDFVDYSERKQNLVILTATMKFIRPLKSHDKFYVTCKLMPTEYPYQFAFDQEIKLAVDNKKIMKARFTSTCVNENASESEDKLYIPEEMKIYLNK